MGLDMDLIKNTYIGAQYEHRNITGNIEIYRDGKSVKIEFKRIEYITEYVGYWCKANQIHHWFVSNVQYGVDDCRKHEVTKTQLKQLLELCIKVRDESVMVEGKVKTGTIYKDGKKTVITEDGKIILNTQVAEHLLPATAGYFFGSTDYDQHYMEDIIYTIEILTPIVQEEEDVDVIFEYDSSW